MGDPEPPEFGSLEEELEYWKEQAARHQQRCATSSVYRSIDALLLSHSSVGGNCLVQYGSSVQVQNFKKKNKTSKQAP